MFPGACDAQHGCGGASQWALRYAGQVETRGIWRCWAPLKVRGCRVDVEGLCVFVSFGSKMLSQRRAAAGDAMNCDAGALDGHRGRQLPAYGQEVERRSSFWLCVYWYIQSAKVYGDARRGASPQGQGGRGDGLLLKTAA